LARGAVGKTSFEGDDGRIRAAGIARSPDRARCKPGYPIRIFRPEEDGVAGGSLANGKKVRVMRASVLAPMTAEPNGSFSSSAGAPGNNEARCCFVLL